MIHRCLNYLGTLKSYLVQGAQPEFSIENSDVFSAKDMLLSNTVRLCQCAQYLGLFVYQFMSKSQSGYLEQNITLPSNESNVDYKQPSSCDRNIIWIAGPQNLGSRVVVMFSDSKQDRNPAANFRGPVISIGSIPYSYLQTDFTIRLIVFQRILLFGVVQKKAEFKAYFPTTSSTVERKVVVELMRVDMGAAAINPMSMQHPPYVQTTEYLHKSALYAFGMSLSQHFRMVSPICFSMNYLLSVPLKNLQVYSGFFSRRLFTEYFIFHGIISYQLVWKMLNGIFCSGPAVLFATYLVTNAVFCSLMSGVFGNRSVWVSRGQSLQANGALLRSVMIKRPSRVNSRPSQNDIQVIIVNSFVSNGEVMDAKTKQIDQLFSKYQAGIRKLGSNGLRSGYYGILQFYTQSMRILLLYTFFPQYRKEQ